MNEKIIRPGLIKRVVDLLKCRNKKYTQEDVENIVSAFWDVIIDALSNGDSVNLNGYATIGTSQNTDTIFSTSSYVYFLFLHFNKSTTRFINPGLIIFSFIFILYSCY